MKKIYFLSLCSIVFWVGVVKADTPIPNQSYTLESAHRQAIVEFIPQGGWGGYGKGTGIAYKISGDQKEKLWQVGFYSGQAILSNDGKYLIAFGPWASSPDDLALAFYHDGVLLKEYRIRELIRDKSKLQRTVSHFFWLDPQKDPRKGFDEARGVYFLELIDGTSYEFNISTGEIL